MTAGPSFCVIGGGIVGLAAALALQRQRPDGTVTVLEKEKSVGQHQTSHNSGVIHSGIYYAPGSHKARLCRAGLLATRQFCDEEALPYRTIGKLIVATSRVEMARLQDLRERGVANGVEVRAVGAAELVEMEPRITGLGALLVPETGIVNYQLVVSAMRERVVRDGGAVLTDEEVASIRETDRSVLIRTRSGTECEADFLIACAGLQADRVARMAGVTTSSQIVPFRGEYYDLVGKPAYVQRLIYPVPNPDLPFLGVHVSPALDGSIHVGPNAVLSLARERYRRLGLSGRDLARMARFPGLWRLAVRYPRVAAHELLNSWWKRGYLNQVRRYCPELVSADLRRAGCGIRAQAIAVDGRLLDDFVIHDSPRSVHVLNAPSPAATAALPIGESVATRLLERLVS